MMLCGKRETMKGKLAIDAHARIRTGTTWTEIQYTLHSLPQMDKENCAFLLSVSVIRATIILGDELEG